MQYGSDCGIHGILGWSSMNTSVGPGSDCGIDSVLDWMSMDAPRTFHGTSGLGLVDSVDVHG